MYKVDLHTHSTSSPDGGISLQQYRQALDNKLLDVIAITDHNRIDFALHAREVLGDNIIVGEEIMTKDGEIIGLYLEEVVTPHQSVEDTIKAIKSQGGIVYIPHPFETIRSGLHPEIIERHTDDIDIIEFCNGRAFAQNRSKQTILWGRLNKVPGAASSDAHGAKGLGKTYSTLPNNPNKSNLVELFRVAQLTTNRPSLRELLYPKFHRTIKKLKGVKS